MMKVTCRCGAATEYELEADPFDPYAHCDCDASHQVNLDTIQTEPCIRTRVTPWGRKS